MLGFIEKESCNISFMHQNQKIKLNDYYMNIDPQKSIAADFECLNIPVEPNNDSFKEKLFLSEPAAIGFFIVKKPD